MSSDNKNVVETVELSDTEVQEIAAGGSRTATKGKETSVLVEDKSSFFEAWPSKFSDGQDGKK